MPENNEPREKKEPTAIIVSQINLNPEKYGSALREKSKDRALAQVAALIQKREETFDIIIQSIQNIKNSPAEEAQKRAFNAEKFITDVVVLVDVISNIIGKLQLIIGITDSRYELNPNTGEPLLNDENLKKAHSNVFHANRHLSQIGGHQRVGQIQEELDIVQPDQSNLSILKAMNDDPVIFLDGGASIKIFNAINDYLNSIIQATELGVMVNVTATRKKFDEIAVGIKKIADVKTESEAFGLNPAPEIRDNWILMIEEIEKSLSLLYLKMEQIYGKNAAFMLSQIEVESLENYHRKLHREMKEIKETIYKMTGESNREVTVFIQLYESLRKIYDAILRLLDLRKNPPHTWRIVKNKLDQTETLKNNTLRALAARRKMDNE